LEKIKEERVSEEINRREVPHLSCLDSEEIVKREQN